MKLFVVCCFSLLVWAAGGVPLDSDTDESVEELLNEFLSRKSKDAGLEDESKMEADEQDEEGESLEMRVLAALLSSEEDQLISDLQTRMSAKRKFNLFLRDTLIPAVANCLRDATENLPQEVVSPILRHSDPDFACRLVQSTRPQWLVTLRRAFPDIEDIANGFCNAK